MPDRDTRESPQAAADRSAQSAALRLALLYGLTATAWIVFSDAILASLGLPRDVEREIAAMKGVGFVIVTAASLYLITYLHARDMYLSEERSRRVFENATEGLTMYKVERDGGGQIVDLRVVDMNPTEVSRMGLPRDRVVGARMSECEPGSRLAEHFRFVKEAVEGKGPEREELYFDQSGDYELIMAYPIAGDLWAAGGMDITALRTAREELQRQDERIRRAYVDVLDAVTGGKLILMTERELDAELGRPITSRLPIASPENLSEARRNVREALRPHSPDLASSPAVLNPLGEALNNVLKHANGGTYQVFLTKRAVQVCVADDGPGIDFHTLPKATLVAGFSTKATLGMGFTIMLQLCDRVLLSTAPGRTAVVLEVALDRAEESEHLDHEFADADWADLVAEATVAEQLGVTER